jgi:predicted alpha/beta-fold hydrolase
MLAGPRTLLRAAAVAARVPAPATATAAARRPASRPLACAILRTQACCARTHMTGSAKQREWRAPTARAAAAAGAAALAARRSRPAAPAGAAVAVAAAVAASAAAATAVTIPLPALAAALALALAVAALARARAARLPSLSAAATPFNAAVLSRCPSLHAPVATPALLSNGHVETIYAALARRPPAGIAYKRSLLRTADGGTVALDALAAPPPGCAPLPPDAPVLIILPGLTGGSHDPYVQHLAAEAAAAGMRACVFNSRGTSDGPVTTPQFYSASFTGDLAAVIAHVAAQHPDSPLVAAGYSLGANILVNYLGEAGESTPLAAAVSLCNPFDLVVADAAFSVGFNRVYDANLARSLRTIFRKHAHLWEDEGATAGKPFKPALAADAATIREFDDAITRVSFGFESVDAYYRASGSAARVGGVSIPLLCLQAEDDPIAPAAAIPRAGLAANPHCVLATTARGGHLGWCAGPGGPTAAPWSDAPTIEFLYSALLERYRRGWAPVLGRDGVEGIVAAAEREEVRAL